MVQGSGTRNNDADLTWENFILCPCHDGFLSHTLHSLSLHNQQGLIFHFFPFYFACLLSLYEDFRSVSTFKTFAAP